VLITAAIIAAGLVAWQVNRPPLQEDPCVWAVEKNSAGCVQVLKDGTNCQHVVAPVEPWGCKFMSWGVHIGPQDDFDIIINNEMDPDEKPRISCVLGPCSE
jgi:hypothetical protein